MKRNVSVSGKISIIVLILVFISTLVIGAFGYILYRRDSISESAEKAQGIAESVATFIDPDQFTRLMATCEENEYYRSCKRYIDDVMMRTGLEYLYLLDKNYDSQVTYFMEGAPPGETDFFGLGEKETVEVHADEVFETLRTGKSTVSGVYYAEEYGSLISGFAPILDRNGAVIGIVGADVSLRNVIQASNMFGLIIIIGVVVFSAIIWLVSGTYLKKQIGRPINMLSSAANMIAKGDLSAQLTVHSQDEIGALTESFIDMMDSTKKQIAVLESLANGDLTAEISLRSEHDSMSYAMIKTMDNLNGMFTHIQNAASQVFHVSNSLSSGAQLLAQGSTQQAASVDHLSDAVSEIAGKTHDNAEMAGKAAELSKTVIRNAEDGSRKMEEMTSAVGEINQANKSIGKVIKVIDDIAFQTNILALNAAVEAARAGQHGKGFAVVAEEVRNLAAKSAEAARETGGLIANSMEKAELGSQIAAETAESLAGIVVGVNESNKIINEIARSSEEQSVGLKQINRSIGEVAQVVQQNSATAQESAAATEEMSSQSAFLQELIAQFRLRDGGEGKNALPSHGGENRYSLPE